MVEGTIIVTGANGMLGYDVLSALSERNMRGIGYGKEALDITSDDLEQLDEHEPGAIINCAAYTDVDRAELERKKCWSVNVEGTRNLAEYCAAKDILLVQISTDYVFNGKKKGYDEDDSTNPINYYGKSKEAAEEIARTVPRHMIVRTAWLYGHNGKNFVDTIIGLARTEKRLKVVNDEHGNPTHTKDIARAILDTIDSDPGVYHITNSGECTWHEFAKEIVRIAGLDPDVVPVPAATYKRVARRPTYSILNNNKTEKLRHWKEALKEYLEQ